jgi:undecaprenyl-diphosphatase
MAKRSNLHQLRVNKSAVVILLILLIAIYVFLPQIKDLRSSLSLARHADRGWLILAAAFVVITYLFATLSYQLLARHRLKVRRTLLIQISSACANRLLPAGLGGLSLNTAYLYNNKHKLAEASTVAATNNLLGIVGHLLVLGAALLFLPSSVKFSNSFHVSRGIYISLIVVIVGLIATILVLPKIRHWLEDFSWQVIRDIGAYGKHPLRLTAALFSSIGLTLCYVLALLTCMLAFGVHLDFTQVLIIFTLGSVVGIATPTPGGLIGIEAGLIAGFVAFGISSPKALAIVLSYRFISYWLPILPGFIALVYVRRRHLIAGP